jgi:hypothetical protein
VCMCVYLCVLGLRINSDYFSSNLESLIYLVKSQCVFMVEVNL